MKYLININRPIFYIWAGHFIKETNSKWIHRDNQHAQDFELLILSKGKLYLKVNDQPVFLKAGDVLFTPPFTHIVGSQPSTGDNSQYWTHFFASYQALRDDDPIIEKLTKGKGPSLLDNYIVMPNQFTLYSPTHIYLLFEQLLNITSEKRNISRGNDLFLSYFLTAVSNDYLQGLSKKKEQNKIDKISEWIKVNISPHLTVNDVAHKFELNPSYLSREFKKEVGIPLKSYIIDMKLDHAKYLLIASSLSISEIAYRSYFSDAKLFMHTFKKKVGTTPSDYRKIMNATNYNSDLVDYRRHVPAEFGTAAIRKLIYQIVQENKKQI